MIPDLKYTVEENEKGLMIKGLLKYKRGLSSRLIRKLKSGQGQVFLNGAKSKLIAKVEPGDEIGVVFPKEKNDYEPEDIPIDVIYEDEHMLAINKQSGYVVHPTKGHPNHTIANGLMKYVNDKGDNYKIRFVNRLDMDTTGVLLIGKNPYIQSDFAEQGSKGRIIKEYITFVQGVPQEEEGIIDLPIEKVHEDKVERVVSEDGKASVTRYQVIDRFPNANKNGGYSMLRIIIETGRTHQIRVHMAHIGHPVLGDHLYGKDAVWLIERQALHASKLTFTHPVTKKELSITAPLPKDMEMLSNKLTLTADK